MDTLNIDHEFIENSCKIKFKVPQIGKHFKNLDVYTCEYILLLNLDIYEVRFESPRIFDLANMKTIPIYFDSEHSQFTCILPCNPGELETEQVNKQIPLACDFKRITDWCTFSLDGNICDIQANYPYGFSSIYRGKPKFFEGGLSQICRIADPSCISPIRRGIMREKDEETDFSPEQYTLDLGEIQLPEGYEDPMKYTISFDENIKLSKDEEYILEKIKAKHAGKVVDGNQKLSIDCGLVSILLGICYDIRLTENEPTCESHWTRTILSPVLSYFETLNNFHDVVLSFCRRSLVYPLYRNFKLSRLCVQDVAETLLKGKSWILKQLLITYHCFEEAENSQKALNKYFIRHYIWYVDSIMDDGHFQKISFELDVALNSITEKDLRLGLEKIQLELFKEVMSQFSEFSIAERSDVSSESESEKESE